MAVRAKKGRPKTPALPDTTDAVEIAMQDVARDPSPDNPARTLLDSQNELIRAEIAQLARLRWRDYILTIFGVLLLALMALFVWGAAGSRAVVVEPFDAPPSLAERGVTGQVLAGSVQDAIATIQAINFDAAMQRDIDNAWTDDIAVEVPTTGISVTELDRLLRQRLGRETYVRGSLVNDAGGTVALTIRATGVPPRTFTDTDAQLPQLTARAAEYVYGMFEPRLFARYLINQGRIEEALAFIEPAYARAPAEYRSALAASWAVALDLQGRGAESVAKTRLAIELDPENWIAASNLIGSLYEVEGEESAAREGRALQRRGAAASTKPPPSLNYLQNYQPLVEDWTGLIDNLLRTLETTGGMGSLATGDIDIYLSDAEANRHDWRAAQRYLLAGSGDESDNRAQRLLNHGLRALEADDLPRATASLERFHAMWQADPSLQWSFYHHPCYLALAYGRRGRIGEANAIFDAVGEWSSCATLRADVIEASGDRRGADAAYTAAVRLAPSLPRAYQHWGVTLMARGDLEGARAKFAAAHERGPRWADPLKSLGDIAMAEGNPKEAARLYGQASAFAPGWAELAEARHAAEADAAALPWWSRWFG